MSRSQRIRCSGWVGLLLAVLLMGCSGSGRVDWKSRIGVLTYDEALLELGPPNHVADLSDGGKVAEWLQHSSRVYSVGPTYGAWAPWWGAYGGGTVTSTPSVFLLLTFGPDLKLANARHVYK